jgi:hypothetical protein
MGGVAMHNYRSPSAGGGIGLGGCSGGRPANMVHIDHPSSEPSQQPIEAA